VISFGIFTKSDSRASCPARPTYCDEDEYEDYLDAQPMKESEADILAAECGDVSVHEIGNLQSRFPSLGVPQRAQGLFRISGDKFRLFAGISLHEK
jgi:hypothetical protein